MSSYNLVTGSYSPLDAEKRRSEGYQVASSSVSSPGEVADTGGVVLLTSRMMQTDIGVSSLSDDRRRSTRCYSADFASTVVLPIKVVKPSQAIASPRPRTSSRSAPCSPQAYRSSMPSSRSSLTSQDCDIITSTSELVEWPRYSNSVSLTKTTRGQGWSSRRAIRKTKKPQMKSKFYVQSPTDDDGDKSNESPESKVYFTITTEDDLKRSPTKPMYNTLPARMMPDFSGHDYDESSDRPKTLNCRKSQTNDNLPDQKFSSISSETSVLTAIPLSSFRTSSEESQHHAKINHSLLQHPSRIPSNQSETSSLASVGFLSEDVFDDDTQQSDSLCCHKNDVTNTSPGVQNGQMPPPRTPTSDQNGNKVFKIPLSEKVNRNSHPPKINIECASPISPLTPERLRVYTDPTQKRAWRYPGDTDDSSHTDSTYL